MSGLSTQLADSLPQHPAGAPGWLQSLRQRGAEQFRAHGLPTPRDEAWKYTRLGRLDSEGLKIALQPVSELPLAPHAEPLVESPCQVNMLDGRMLSLEGSAPAGLSILPLGDALTEDNAALKSLLESLQNAVQDGRSADGFTALNTATLDAGLFIHVAAGQDGGRLLLNWAGSAGEAPTLSNSRVCVMLEEGASLELLEQFETPADSADTCNIVLQIDLQEGAGLQHVRFQQEPDAAALITRTEVSQHANSDYAYYGFDLGGGLVRHDLHASILGNGARAVLSGAYLLDGNRHVDNHARVDHMAPGGSSEQYFRGVAGGSGRAVFNTAVCVHPGADETEALQSNGNILLSARAEVDTKPELEIYADEVVASHGATVGQLDELAVFYLRSRGLSEQDARQLLTSAFCQSVSDKLADRALGDVISERMKRVMPQAD